MDNASIRAALTKAVDLGEIGIQVAAYRGEDLILDSSIGEAQPGVPVSGDTLFPIFSVTKALTLVAVHIQAERGLVDYDDPIAAYWPEFAAHGKGGVTIRHVLTHRSGVPGMPSDTTPELMADWNWMVTHLADLEPLYPPGTKNAYASYSFGWLLGEVVRRTDPMHRPFCQFVQDEVCRPIGVEELWLGLPPAEEERVAILAGGYEEPTGRLRRLAVPPGIPIGPALFNLPLFHQACIPSANGVANARSVARFFAMLANGGELGGVRLLSEARVRSFTRLRPNSYEFDEILNAVALVGEGGFWLSGNDPVVGDSPHVLLHTGGGGTYAWADLDSRLAVAILHNRMFTKASAHADGGSNHPFKQLGEAIRGV